MPLTTAQLQTLKTDITAKMAAGQPLVSVSGSAPGDSDANTFIANYYKVTASPDFFVWRDLPMETVLNTITFASMTPLDAVPTTPSLTVDVYRARALACQGKQFNLQNLTLGRTTAPMKRTNYRAAMQDCLTNIPAGAAGALLAANWVGVRDAAKFLANRAEALLATGTGSQAVPADLPINFEGSLTYQDIEAARTIP